MKFCITLFFALTFSAFAQQDQKLSDGRWAYYGEEFYATLKAGQKLDRTQLHRIFNENHASVAGRPDALGQCGRDVTCYRQISVGYDRARKIMFGELDTLRDGQGTYVLDVYCGKKFYFKSIDEVPNMHAQVNIEHTWPQSKFNGNFAKDMQKSDMHHLFLSDSKANSVRGNSPFGLVGEIDNRMGGEGCGKSKMGFMIDGREVYTPPAPHRGNVARALFYFSMHYNLGIDQTQERILREWHKNDPVDAAEIKRHEGIARYQKIRNPFVDHPQIVDKIGDF